MRFTNRFRPLVAVACISAFLSGCGGGSDTRTDTEMLEGPCDYGREFTSTHLRGFHRRHV